MIAQLGLEMFLFLLGCELQVDKARARGATLWSVVLLGMGLPFAVAAAVALPGHSLTCAAIGDGVTWGVLTLVVAATHLNGASDAVAVLAAAGALVFLTLLCVRPALAVLIRKIEALPGSDGHTLLVLLVAGALGYSIGLETSVGLLGFSPAHWAYFFLVLLVAMLTKVLGAGGGARLAGIPAGCALRVGILMNCRGVTELVVASIGYQDHLINSLGLTILVLMAILSTVGTAPLLKLVDRRADRSADCWDLQESSRDLVG